MGSQLAHKEEEMVNANWQIIIIIGRSISVVHYDESWNEWFSLTTYKSSCKFQLKLLISSGTSNVLGSLVSTDQSKIKDKRELFNELRNQELSHKLSEFGLFNKSNQSLGCATPQGLDDIF